MTEQKQTPLETLAWIRWRLTQWREQAVGDGRNDLYACGYRDAMADVCFAIEGKLRGTGAHLVELR